MSDAGSYPGLYQKRGWYYYQPPGSREDRPKAIALKTKDFVIAVGQAQREADNAVLKAATRKMTLEEILPKYYAAKRDDAATTKQGRKVVLEGFKEILGNPRLDSITTESIQAWRDHVKTKGASPDGRGPASNTTLKSYLIILRAFIRWSLDKGYLKTDPIGALGRQARVRGVTRRMDFMVETERNQCLSVQPLHRYTELILLLGFFHGLREGEILAATPDWIWIADDWSQGFVTVQDTEIVFADGTKGWFRPKGRRSRKIPMHPRLIAWFKRNGVHGPFLVRPDKDRWPNDNKQSKRYDARKALRRVAKLAEVSKLNMHLMRRTFATHLAMRGVKIAVIAALLGDRVAVAEEHYAGYSPSEKNPVAML